MRTTSLLRVAAEAEVLLVRQQIKGVQRRAIYGAVAALFGISVLVTLHIMAGMALVQYAGLSPFVAVLIVFGVDVAIAVVFALLASGTVRDPVVEEARELRDRSLAQVKDTLSAAAVLRPAGRLLGRKHVYGLALAALTARYLGAGSAAKARG